MRFFKKNKKDIEIEPEEILFSKKEDFLERKIEPPLNFNIFLNLRNLFLVIAVLFLLMTFKISIIDAKIYQDKAISNISRSFPVLPERGKIFDRNGKILAENEITFSLWFLPNEFSFEKKNLDFLSNFFKDENLIKKIKESQGRRKKILLKENIGLKEAAKISSLDLNGFYLEKSFKRKYPDGEIFSHIIGYLKKPNEKELKKYFPLEMIGASGVESFYQDKLRGIPGKKIIERKKNGGWKEILIEKAKKGKDLYLTIDSNLQKVSFNALNKGLKAINSKKGVALVMDSNSGEILVMVSAPSFDNNIFIEGDSKKIKEIFENLNYPLYNRAVSGQYPPASTIKPFLGISALEEGIVTPKTLIDDRPGYLKIKNPYYPDKFTLFHDWKIHGIVDLKKALAVSCDIYFYLIGGGGKNIKGLGARKIIKYLKQFNFGKKTGIDLLEEKSGLVPEIKENWYLGDTYNLSIGQGKLLVTPIQLLTAFNSLFNEGKIIKPHLLKDEKEKIIKKVSFKKEFFEAIKDGLRDVVVKPYGTGYYLSSLGLEIAGKSGTAQVGKEKYLSWFVGVVPYSHPKISFLVLVEDAKWGRLNTLPIVYEILKQWDLFQRKNTKN